MSMFYAGDQWRIHDYGVDIFFPEYSYNYDPPIHHWLNHSMKYFQGMWFELESTIRFLKYFKIYAFVYFFCFVLCLKKK